MLVAALLSFACFAQHCGESATARGWTIRIPGKVTILTSYLYLTVSNISNINGFRNANKTLLCAQLRAYQAMADLVMRRNDLPDQACTRAVEADLLDPTNL